MITITILFCFVALSLRHAEGLVRDPNVLLHKYYSLKYRNPAHAFQFLQALLAIDPNNPIVLRELDELINHHANDVMDWLDLFTRHRHQIQLFLNTIRKIQQYLIQKITIESTLNQFIEPLRHEHRNAFTASKTIALPIQTNPYFGELFFTPLTQSRFNLSVAHLLLRYGMVQHNKWQTREYVFNRITKDNKSKNIGQITQLYEDDVALLGVGVQTNPSQKWPIMIFLETAAAYDLIYQNRPRWRPDLRTGMMYYQEQGTTPDFSRNLVFAKNYMATYYANATYFTRYTNFIGEIRTNQGIRLAQWHHSTLNLYVTGRLVQDTLRLFYNNYLEVGPGLTWTPFQFASLKLRAESVRGRYLPAGKTPNPYPSYYNNSVLQLIWYGQF